MGTITKTCRVLEIGSIGYEDAFALQQQLVAARKRDQAPDVLLLCEHPHVLTLGRSGKLDHLRAPDALLRQMGVELHSTNRGGDITYHGPGQIVAYPILHLGAIRRDVGWYVRQLEETMIRAAATFGLESFRVSGRTGVWTRPAPSANGGEAPEEKLGAIGVHISRWVTSHGFAFNVSTDLRYFDLIVPCGIANRRPTSLEKLLGLPVPMADASGRLVKAFGSVFGFEMIAAGPEDLSAWLGVNEPADAAIR